MTAYTIHDGMPKEIFINKYSRLKEDGTYQSWEERITEVITGNFLLDSRVKNIDEEFERTLELAKKGIIVLSGRHLQHGDTYQLSKNGDKFSNCSTALFSFTSFYLLLQGSGVGRCFDSDVAYTDFEYMPNLRFVLSSSHPDYEFWIESREEAEHKYDSEGEDVRWFTVEDSAEGWVKVVAIIETAAFHKNNKDKLFVFDLTPIRKKGDPIRGQQNRPSSGPVPFIKALMNLSSIKGAGYKPWKQALFIDHYLSACVALGGVRRSARMSTKNWKDRDIIDFINIKRGGWLYTSNNSITVDEEFWQQAKDPKPSHARRVFEAAISAAYWDNTGEPGFINIDKLHWNNEGIEKINETNYISDYHIMKFHGIHNKTVEMFKYVIEKVRTKKYPYITNPCVTADTWIFTSEGPRQVSSLIGRPFEAIVNGKAYKSQGFFKTGTDRQTFLVLTNRGFNLSLTDNHLVTTIKDGFKQDIQVKYLKPNDEIVLNKTLDYNWQGEESFAEGVLAGENFKNSKEIVENSSSKFYIGFLRGLFDNHAEINVYDCCIVLLVDDIEYLVCIQRMLLRLGIVGGIYNVQSNIELPNKVYKLIIYDHNVVRYSHSIGAADPEKQYKLDNIKRIIESNKEFFKFETFTDPVKEIISMNKQDVYDCTVEEINHFDANGIIVHNCSEIVLSSIGAYCIVGDTALHNASSIKEAIEAVGLTAKILVRTNLMKFMYEEEVKRTNRIGVSLIGLHEFAAKIFNYDFWDLLNEEKSLNFWQSIKDMRLAVEKSANEFSDEVGLSHPHTYTCLKPAGTLAKVFDCTEAANLPSMPYYMRWIQFPANHPMLTEYTKRGYPVRDISKDIVNDKGITLKGYPNVQIVGFPTKQLIADILGDRVVCAGDLSIAQHFKWLQLLEKYWLGEGSNNSISYTLKFDPEKIKYQEFIEEILKYQPTVRCCSVMPQINNTSYIYTPEESITKDQYDFYMQNIDRIERESIDDAMLDCEGGACGVDVSKNLSIAQQFVKAAE